MIFALAGNQNCGKTTLFNQLTGSNQHVGNFPGVTVDQKSGQVRGQKDCTVVDLPGIYSLRPYTAEEIVTRNFILEQKPDCIINIVDATNLERNLYLTLQLLTLQVPTVLALNMMDELTGNGGSVDTALLSELLGVPVTPICAANGEGVEELIESAVRAAQQRQKPAVYDFCPKGPVHRCIHAVCHVIEDHAQAAGIGVRFAATKLIEGDEQIADELHLDPNELELIEHSVVQMEQERGLDRNAALADMRYSFIENAVEQAVVKPRESREHLRSSKLDRVLTGKYTAIPVFLGVMLLIFYLTFNVIGKFLSDLLAMGIDALTALVDRALTAYGLNPVVHSLIIDGIFKGVGGVLSFLPIIVTLFFFLSILEDTGYMARVAFVMELPNYRFPSVKSVALLLWEKAKDFLQRAFSVIFLATIAIWFLQSFDARLNVVASSSDSLLAMIGRLVAPVFAPLGFADWRCATALISGFIAKESVVSTLQILLGGAGVTTLLSTTAAVSFLVFTLLYTPCVAAIAAIRREVGSGARAAMICVSQCCVAWLCAFVVFTILRIV